MASSTPTPFGFNPATSSFATAPAPVEATTAAPSSLLSQAKSTFAKINQFRDSLNLPHPGTYEGSNREVKSKLPELTDGQVNGGPFDIQAAGAGTMTDFVDQITGEHLQEHYAL
ncbi:hypothetical protein KVV02_000906 [Mortierella alpina]|uniref:Uncharacterized protein n=1 Tax=Mortierella alpina TaxID=64518 RepID=A0A9P8D2C0_MORAP|nr:hypothetical protein KVV02_000906 [Mortierella alpina]